MKLKIALKLALANIKANKQIYVPFVGASTLTIAMFYMIVSLLSNSFVGARQESLVPMFRMGSGVIAIFSLAFIFYANSFLMKRRKKEIGLYNILGLEKKHIARIIGIETVLTFLASITLGLISGMALGQLTFYVINFILILPEELIFTVSLIPIGLTAALFILVFIVTYVYNILNIQFSNPIELLKGGKAGEKEPKSSPFLFLMGLLSLGSGYVISLMIDNPIDAFMMFFVAVLLVMIGTYLLFNAGTIIVLKALKKNKKLYYKPGPFISISGMLYRMKQHATGLANICLLSAMVLITISTTVALYSGGEEMIERAFPSENSLSITNSDGLAEDEFESTIVSDIIETVEQRTEDSAVEMEELQTYQRMSVYNNQIKNNEFLYARSGLVDFSDEEDIVTARFVSLDDYNKLMGQEATLEDGEILYYESTPVLEGNELNIEGRNFTVTRSDSVPQEIIVEGSEMDNVLIVLSDSETLMSIKNLFNGYESEYKDRIDHEVIWSTTGTQEEKLEYGTEMSNLFSERIGEVFPFYQNKEVFRVNYYDLTGGFLFLGIYLGFLFVIGTVLITYFKQISEGYEDRIRIQAMQKVGLDKKMTRKATRSQVVWMFILPLIVAILHTAVAYPILYQMLSLFSFIEHSLMITTIAIVSLAFSLIYGVVYQITSRIYLKIVE